MRFGFMLLPRSLAETRAAARLGQALGFSWVSIADSPTVYEESFLHQLEAARAAPEVSVGPMVSHVVARHPVIVANLFSTMSEFTDGRMIGTLATGNSAARGLGLRPATVARLREAVLAIRGYWRGDGGSFAGSRIPATGVARRGCPIFISADGPRAAELSGEVGDGLIYGGTLAPEVGRRRLAAARCHDRSREAWIAPTVSLALDHPAVDRDLGAMVVAMSNRALRGDLDERGVPADVQDDVLAVRTAYDYGFHADSTRPRNRELLTERLRSYLIDSLCIWGDEARWAAHLDALEAEGWTGVMFILGQVEQLEAVRATGERLRAMGRLFA